MIRYEIQHLNIHEFQEISNLESKKSLESRDPETSHQHNLWQLEVPMTQVHHILAWANGTTHSNSTKTRILGDGILTYLWSRWSMKKPGFLQDRQIMPRIIESRDLESQNHANPQKTSITSQIMHNPLTVDG